MPALRALTEWFASRETPYLVIGGMAIALVARSRATDDIDSVVLIDEDKLQEFVDAAVSHGFVPRKADAVEFARTARVLLLRHGPSGVDVDISLGALAFEHDSIARGMTVQAGGISVRVPLLEDLIIMKAVSGRPLDLADIDTILDMQPEVDRDRVRRAVLEFAELLEQPELVGKIEELLDKKRIPVERKQKRRRKS